jgi:hypothetical protein
VNDAPVSSSGATLGATQEDTVSNAVAFATLFGPLVSDIESGDAQLSIVITSVANAVGTWQRGSSGAFVTVAVNDVVSLSSATELRFAPFANQNGVATMGWLVRDPSNAESAAQTVSVTVSAVNDAPVAVSSVTLSSTPEDTTTPAVLLSALFGFPGVVNDVDNTRSQLTIVVVATAGAAGAWQSDVGGSFVALAANSVLPLSVSAAQLRFVPAAHQHGIAVLTWRVRDTAGLDSAATQNVSVAVNVVNDAPVAELNVALSPILEDGVSAERSASVLFAYPSVVSDVDDAQGALSIVFSSLASAVGSWQTDASGSWVAIAENAIVSLGSSAKIRFVPAPNQHGTATASWRVRDAAGATSVASKSLSIVVTAVNDAPTIAASVNLTSISEDETDSVTHPRRWQTRLSPP